MSLSKNSLTEKLCKKYFLEKLLKFKEKHRQYNPHFIFKKSRKNPITCVSSANFATFFKIAFLWSTCGLLFSLIADLAHVFYFWAGCYLYFYIFQLYFLPRYCSRYVLLDFCKSVFSCKFNKKNFRTSFSKSWPAYVFK